ncbi:MAG: hypothetical protein M3Q57_00460 [Pseudomonadota bacterium]|nr:hypothetical protein [Pseudomonadota bacterium]
MAAAPLAAQSPVGETPDTAPATQATRTTAYDAAFFAPFAPRSALDIARRVPGFTLEQGNSDIRGFAGAAGNVVFNGARPSSKAESLETLLARIPAQRVVRVELGSGSLYGSEYSGKSQVLNVILSAGAGIDGTVTASARRRYTGLIIPNLSASTLIKRGSSSFGLSAGTGRQDTLDEGTDTQTDPDTGALVEFRRKHNHYRPRSPFVSASYSHEPAPDRAIHLNGRFQRDSEDFNQTNRVFPAGGPDRDDRLFLTFKSPGFEIGGDASRPLAGGAIKLVALANRRHRETLDTALERRDGIVEGGFEQGTESQRNETIGRLSWTRADLAGWAVETGAEASLNTLDYHLDLFILGAGGARTRLDLPLDDATVREERAEIYGKAGRQISKALRVDAGLNVEASRLKVRGDTRADRSLKFLKPSVTLDWKPGDGWHSQLSLRRSVSQLDFFDFISAAELSNDRLNGGNANLLPQRTWEARATVDHPLLGTGLIKLDAGYDRISLLQDRILTEEGLDAPGNIGTGTRAFAALAADAPLDAVGIKGGRLILNGQIQRTRVNDPISGETRNFTGFFPNWQWSAELRRDIGKFAYGAAVNHRDTFKFFRANEIDASFNSGIYGTAFVEYRPDGRTTVTFDADNLFNTGSLRNRLFTFPSRANPNPSLNELRERNSHRNFGLTVKRTFGGATKLAQTAPTSSPT